MSSYSVSLFQLFLVMSFSFPPSFMGQRIAIVAQRDLWCVAKNNADDQSLQVAIDWACGPGGANCIPIEQGKPCHDPNDIRRTASWAFNDYYLKNGLSDDACFFGNSAALTSLNPSHDGCKFPSSSSVKNGSSSISGSTTTSIGMGPVSADFSGSSQIPGRWHRPILISNLLVMLALVTGA